MIQRFRRGMRGLTRLHLCELETRLTPAALVIPGRAYSPVDVMALVRGSDPGPVLARRPEVADRHIVFVDHGESLVQVTLRPGVDPIAAVNFLAADSAIDWAAPNYLYAD